MSKRLWWKLIGILVLTLVAGVISSPHSWRQAVVQNLGLSESGFGNYIENEKFLLGLDLQGGTHLRYRIDMSNVALSDQDSIVDGIVGVITRRVNALGVSEAIIQSSKIGDGYYIIVELPGIKDIEEAKKRVGKTVQLEFKRQKTDLSAEETAEVTTHNEAQRVRADEALAKAKSGEDFEALVTEYSEGLTATEGGVQDFVFAEDIFSEELRAAIFESPVGDLHASLVETANGFYVIKVLETQDGEKELVNADGSTDSVTEESRKYAEIFVPLRPLIPLGGWEDTGLTGEHFKHASATPQGYSFQVAIQFDDVGKELFKTITEEELGNPVAIFLDDELISAPTVQSVIADGQAVITGNFTSDEALELAMNLNTGAIPAPIHLIGQSEVGATLGQNALNTGLKAGLFGIMILALYLLIYYRLPGLLADIALAIYALIVLMLFKVFNVTLTLAGIAGFILSVGMAVDANILIFERLKEELKSGKALSLAIDTAFKRAWSSIRDSNVSSLITCAILFFFGTGIVKGFALTLSLGIIASMFSAITITRTFLQIMSSGKKISWLWGASSTSTSDPESKS